MLLNKRIHIGKKHFSLAALCACLLIILAIGVRFIFILHNWPPTNSDEAEVGLMSLHISQGRDFPFFMYGQAVLGSLEAYIGAGLFLLFGPSIPALRIGLLLLFVIFLILFYLLTKRLYTKGLALLTLFLLSFGPIESLSRSVLGTLGHAETPLFCGIIVLLSMHLALLSITPYRKMTTFQRRKCFTLYALWGVMSGIAIWNDALSGSFILASGLYIFIFCRQTLRPIPIGSVLLGLCVGVLPLVMHDVLLPYGQAMLSNGQHSLDVLHSLTHRTQAMSMLQRWKEGFLVSLPASTGASGICYIQPLEAWPLSPHSSPYVRQCTATHSIWAVIVAAIWFIAIILEMHNLYQLRKTTYGQPASTCDRTAQKMVVHGARLLLLGAAGLVWLVFSSTRVQDSAWSTRYLIGMVLATPAMLWPLWSQITSGLERRRQFLEKRGLQILCGIVLLMFTAIQVKGTIHAFSQFPGGMPLLGQQNALTNTQQNALTNTLVRLHVKHLYTEYWTCNFVIFFSHEQVICSVADTNLHRGFNRYTPYVSLVEQDPQAAYLFPTGAPQIPKLNAKLAQEGRKYQVTSFEGYVLYQFTSGGTTQVGKVCE